MVPPHQPFDPGQMPVWSTTFACPVASASTTSTRSEQDLEIAQALLLLSKASSTPAFPLPSSEATSSDKSTSSRKRTRDTESSETSPPASTSRDPACVPFWKPSTGEWSRKLWSCTATALHDSPVTYWSTSSARKDAGSWYTVAAQVPKTPKHLLKTSWPSQQSLWRLITENEQRKDDAGAEKQAALKKRKQARSKAKKVYNKPRATKYRVHPLKGQRETLKKWFGLSRRAYNTAVAVHKALEAGDKEVVTAVGELTNEVKLDKEGNPVLRQNRTTNEMEPATRGYNNAVKLYVRRKEREEDFVSECPQAIRDSGILDFEKAKRSGAAKREEKQARGEDVGAAEKFKFRKRKGDQVLEINARDWKDGGKIGELFRAMRAPRLDRRPDVATAAIRVKMDKLGRVFLCFVSEREVKSESQAPDHTDAFHSTVALDPGVRTFQTMYDADGQAVEWGKADMTHIMGCSKMKRKRATWSLRRAYYRALETIKDKIKECHRKLALFLCENYRAILIPKFEVSRMVKKRNRKIRSKTVRQMACWSHFSFREALKAKAELFPWVRVVEVNEAYTSKTCEECGKINNKLGGSKTFKCVGCGHCADRDVHAAKNILLRYLTREGIALPESPV
ncbi:Putative transposase A625R [Durusdinium trenchii]|uniref:Transposase A625R n=1 Tax=Durusdinium trenchii TaxID=1381693 RepID=A0ABP0L774_9DINO